MTQPSLEDMKQMRTQLTNLFALLYQAEFQGSKSEAVFNALKFVDQMVGKIQKDIEALEPKPEASVESVTVEPAVTAETV